jgi:hypothetical protein
MLKVACMLVVLGFLVWFACDKYIQAGDVDSLKRGIKNIQESVQTRANQLREINEELERTNR